MAVQSSWKGTRCAVTRQEYSARAKIIPHSGSKNHITQVPHGLWGSFSIKTIKPKVQCKYTQKKHKQWPPALEKMTISDKNWPKSPLPPVRFSTQRRARRQPRVRHRADIATSAAVLNTRAALRRRGSRRSYAACARGTPGTRRDGHMARAAHRTVARSTPCTRHCRQRVRVHKRQWRRSRNRRRNRG